MQTQPRVRRKNRVYKSLHKPLTYLGVERTIFYFVCVGAVGVFNLFENLLAGAVVFVGGYAFGRWVDEAISHTGCSSCAYAVTNRGGCSPSQPKSRLMRYGMPVRRGCRR